MKFLNLETTHRTSYMIVLSSLIFIILMTSAFVYAPQALAIASPITVYIDDVELILDVEPLLIEGRTHVPMRAIFEALGATVQWDGATKTITANKGDVSLRMQIGSMNAERNGEPMMLDTMPQIQNGRTLVPLRFVGEALGAGVQWDGQTRRISIVKPTDPMIIVLPGPIVDPPFIPPFVMVKPDPGSQLQFRPVVGALTDLMYYNPLYDFDLIQQSQIEAIPFIPPALSLDPSVKLDFSEYITFQGSQDGWGGCIGRSMIHVMNILNEMENPYTPDLSFWYIQARQMQLWPNEADIDSGYLLETEGACTEASLPSDYDAAATGSGLDFDLLQWPEYTHFEEARLLYRISHLSDEFEPSIVSIKYLMQEYGPLLAGGPFVKLQGENPAQGHCVTIIGYDDTKEELQFLNSWGDTQHGGDGIFELSYAEIPENIDAIRFIEDAPTNRHLTDHAYSARIDIEPIYNSSTYRNKLKIEIGVEGEEPIIIWDTPNQTSCLDVSRRLSIDVPLPSYAAQYWPPSSENQWYIKITNENDESPIYGIYIPNEITLAHLSKEGTEFISETFSADITETVRFEAGVSRIYIPFKVDMPFTIIPPIGPIGPQ